MGIRADRCIDRVEGDARERVRVALIALVAERGYSDLTLDDVLRKAEVDRAAFEHHYENLDACFAEIWTEARGEVVEVTSRAFTAESSWRDGMRAAAWKLCRWTDSNRDRARIMFVELTFAPERLRAARDFTFAAYAELVHQGNAERAGTEVPKVTAEALVGAIWERLTLTTNAGRFDDLPSQVPEMMYVVVLPYVGAAAASEELQRGPADVERYRRGEL